MRATILITLTLTLSTVLGNQDFVDRVLTTCGASGDLKYIVHEGKVIGWEASVGFVPGSDSTGSELQTVANCDLSSTGRPNQATTLDLSGVTSACSASDSHTIVIDGNASDWFDNPAATGYPLGNVTANLEVGEIYVEGNSGTASLGKVFATYSCGGDDGAACGTLNVLVLVNDEGLEVHQDCGDNWLSLGADGKVVRGSDDDSVSC